VNHVLATPIIAQSTDAAGSGNPLGFILPLVVLGGLFYVFLVLPQRRRMKKLQQLRDSISVGDEVRTVGGIYGRVRGENEDSFVLDVGGGTTLRVAKRAIAARLGDEE